MEESQTLSPLTTLVPFTLLIFIIAVGVLVLNQQFKKNLLKQQLEAERLKLAHQRELLQVSLNAQDAERKRISQDLHDELGATLSISLMQLKQLSASFPDTPLLGRIKEQIAQAMAATRRISHALMPLHLQKMGLSQSLQALADQAEAAGNITVSLALAHNLEDLTWELQLGLYRIYSELLNNTLKHAQASEIEMSILKSQGKLFCLYSDNGKGLGQKAEGAGLGLRSLEARISSLNGHLGIKSRPQGGFHAEMTVPAQPKS